MRRTPKHRVKAGCIAVILLAIGVATGALLTVSQGNCKLQGIDVSHHQGVIEWDAVAESGQIQFAYIKASEGISHRDTRYTYNITRARHEGIKVGSYHYFHPNVAVHKQARNFIITALPHVQDLVPAIDVEESNGLTSRQICDSLALFASLIEKAWGMPPVIYTHQGFYNKHLRGYFDKYPLWIARYGIFFIKPPVRLHDQRTPAIWQYSNRGHVKGINGCVDLNSLCGQIKLYDLTIVK